jgi:hypothetical protein
MNWGHKKIEGLKVLESKEKKGGEEKKADVSVDEAIHKFDDQEKQFEDLIQEEEAKAEKERREAEEAARLEEEARQAAIEAEENALRAAEEERLAKIRKAEEAQRLKEFHTPYRDEQLALEAIFAATGGGGGRWAEAGHWGEDTPDTSGVRKWFGVRCAPRKPRKKKKKMKKKRAKRKRIEAGEESPGKPQQLEPGMEGEAVEGQNESQDVPEEQQGADEGEGEEKEEADESAEAGEAAPEPSQELTIRTEDETSLTVLNEVEEEEEDDEDDEGPREPRGRVEHLLLDENALAGKLDSGGVDWPKLTHLRSLCLSHNAISGPLPTGIGTCHALTILNLSCNRLRGPIAPELSALKKLKFLWLFANR